MTHYDSDPQTPPLPSPNGHCAAQDPEETAAYNPGASWPTTSTAPGVTSTSHERIGFLGSPRAGGELGRLAHYRVLRLLGQGGMGLVFLAEDSLLSRPVALKVVRPEIADTPGIAERFTREARATAAIKHDHIVTIYQVGQENDIPFLAMEYLKGMSLAQWLNRGHSPSVDLVLRIGREIAAGLSAAHGHGLIHRDIKPANIWLEVPSGRVKILDFGMARSQREDVEITRSGMVMGTPAYMAPEQARGEPVEAGSDLFSFGCVLYRLCTCRLPFEGDSIMAVLTALSTTTPRRPRELQPGVPSALDELVMGLLAKDPADRPASAEVVVKELRSIERELLAGRRKAELSAATPLAVVVESTRSAPAEAPLGLSPTKPTPTRRVPRRSLGIAAAAVAALAAAAVMGVVIAPLRQSKVGIAATGPASAPTADQRAVTPSAETAGTAQPGTSPDQVGPQVDPVAVAQASPSNRLEVAQSEASTEPSLPSAREVSHEEARPADQVVPNMQEIGNDTPSVKIADQGRAPERPAPTPRETGSWGDAIDPDGDCRFELEPRENRAKITVPGKTHILSAEIGRVNAPRLIRDIKGDFDLTVRVAGTNHPGGKATTTLYSPYHGGGLLIWQDQENYIRLEIAADIQHGKARPYVNFEYRKDGALAYSDGILNTGGSNHLRFKRRGSEIYASFGPDGVRWASFSPLTAKLNDHLKFGVSAINSSTKPLTVEFEGLEALEQPGAGRDFKSGGLSP
jgi:serine/threonine protein kinase/regulation of enolase protein 1 (concanavalin A-like superfamily)